MFREVGVGRIGVVPLLDVPVLAGRAFAAGDTGAGGRHVVVNRSFARHVLGGDALGRRIRPATGEPGPWFEVVGVSEGVPAPATGPALAQARLYHPAGERDAGLGLLAARVRAGEPAEVVGRVAFETGGTGLLMLPVVAAFVQAVGLLAVAGPTRRGRAIGYRGDSPRAVAPAVEAVWTIAGGPERRQ